MTTYISHAANDAMLRTYCEPHGIDPENIIFVSVEIDNYYIEYHNKDGHYCTIRVDTEVKK